MRDTVIAIVRENSVPSSFDSIFENLNRGGILLATIVGLVAGVYGIRAWRRQLHGTHEFEIGKSSYKAFLKLKEEIDNLRNPMKGIGEIAEVLQTHGIRVESVREFVSLNVDKYIYPKRWQELRSVWMNTRDLKVESEVLWGKKIKDQIEEVDSIIRRIAAAIDTHMRNVDDPDWQSNMNYGEMKKYFEKSHYPEGSDVFGAHIEDVFQRIEKFYGKKVRNEFWLKTVWNWLRGSK